MIRVLALFGASATGKDTICNRIVSLFPNETHKIISSTTRPKRDNEIEGQDYYFRTYIEMINLIANNKMIEATNFNNWTYGTELSSLSKDKLNIGVFNPEGVSNLLENKDVEVYPVKLVADDKIRLSRSLLREENPNCHEICRRFLADEQDFRFLDFDYEEICTNLVLTDKEIKNFFEKYI